MIRNKMFKLVAVLLILAMGLVACTGGNNATVPNNTTDPVEETSTDVEETTEPVASSTGANLDTITMIGVEDAAAVTQLQAGAIDIFAGSIAGSFLKDIQDADLNYAASSGLSYEIMLNNADTVEESGTFNPFAIREVREAMNWLLDRDYIAKEIFSGAAVPRQFAISSFSPDYARYIEYARVEEAKYAFDEARATAAIDKAMTDNGITKNAEGKYVFNGEPVVLKFYIRTEDGLRQPAGDYVANQLDDIGFTVERIYRVSSECSPVVFGSDPIRGEWHLYTGAWGASGLARDTGVYFHDYISPDSRYSYNPWTAFKISDEYNKTLERLAYNDFTNMEEREELFKAAFAEHNYWSTRIWLVDGLSYTPWNKNVSTSYNLSAGVDNDSMTAYTIQFNDKDGGDLVWGNTEPPFVEPVSPIGGTNWTYDSQYLNLTRDYITIADPYTGLRYPKRIESATVTLQKGLPVGQTYDWVDVKFEDEIAVPADAMIDWDVATSTWILADKDYLQSKVTKAEEKVANAEEALAAATEEDKASLENSLEIAKEDLVKAQETLAKGHLTAKRKVSVTFPEDMSSFTWHDGTPVTIADIMMVFIMGYETAYEESPLYDEYLAAPFLSGLDYFKGWRIVSESPIIIERYGDSYSLDAENNVSPLSIGWTYDSNGAQAPWHSVALGNRVIESGRAAYTQGAADADDTVEWLNFIDGPTLEYISQAADELISESYIPFEATMGKYVTKEEAKAAYENTKNFYDTNGHYVVGCGPYYISNVLSTEGSVTMTKYDAYDESSDRWAFLAQPKLATIEFDGPASVSVGSSASFDVYINDPNDAPYPVSDISAVRYLLYSANGEIVEVNGVTSTKDGFYSIELSSDSIDKLGTGACKIEVVVSPKAVAAPSILQAEFIVE